MAFVKIKDFYNFLECFLKVMMLLIYFHFLTVQINFMIVFWMNMWKMKNKFKKYIERKLEDQETSIFRFVDVKLNSDII